MGCGECGSDWALERLVCGHQLCRDCAQDSVSELCGMCSAVGKSSCDVCDTEQTTTDLVWCANESVFKCTLCRRSCPSNHRLSSFADNLAFRQAYETLRVEVNKERKREAGEMKAAVSGLVTMLRSALLTEAGKRPLDLDHLLAHLSPESALDALLTLPNASRPSHKHQRRPKATANNPQPPSTLSKDTPTIKEGESGGRLEGLSDDERRKQIVAFFNPKIGRSRRVLFVDPPRGTLHILDPFRGKYMKMGGALPPLPSRAEYGMAQVGPTTMHFSGGREYSSDSETWSTIRGSVELDLATFQYRFRDATLPSPTLGHGAAHVRDRLFLFGGVVSGKEGSLRLSRDCLVYPDAVRDRPPLKGAPMIHARRGFAVATAPDQSAVYVIGGKNNAGVRAQGRNDPFLKLMSLCERYDPARDVWTPLPSLPEARSDALATCTESGRVMVLGGRVYEMKADCFHATVPSVGVCLDPRMGRWVSAPDTDLLTLNSGFKTNAILVNHPRAGLVLVDGVSGRIGVMEERMESWRVLKGAALDTDVQRQLFNAFPIIA